MTGRINEVAQREQWPWILTDNGLKPISNESQPACDPEADPRVNHTFRWLLKPFVDPEWIDERLTASKDAHWATEQFVGVVVVDESFLHRIPIQRTAKVVADLAEFTDRRGTMADLDVTDRLLRERIASIQLR